jgi:hypothetical protein
MTSPDRALSMTLCNCASDVTRVGDTDFAAATESTLLLLKIRALPKKCRRDKGISKGSKCMEKDDCIFWGNF